MVKQTRIRAVIRLRFREQGESGMALPFFGETDRNRLVGRALAYAWWSAKESAYYKVEPPAALFVEAHGPDPDTWTIAGRFLMADLLGGYDPERWGRLLAAAGGILETAGRCARRLATWRLKKS
jgi:hypothetical protein